MKNADIVKKTGEHPSDISRWLSGKRKITLEKANQIAEKTGLPVGIFTDPELQKHHLGKVKLKYYSDPAPSMTNNEGSNQGESTNQEHLKESA